jgi:hypothetical protein
MMLDLLAQILDDAVEYGLLSANPARGERRRLKVPKPARSFLAPDMVIDLLDAAEEWECSLPPHQRYGRRAFLATLCSGRLRAHRARARITEHVAHGLATDDIAAGSSSRRSRCRTI